MQAQAQEQQPDDGTVSFSNGKRWLTVDGETMSTAEWADELGIDYAVINNRICHGWTVRRALFTPVRSERLNGMFLQKQAASDNGTQRRSNGGHRLLKLDGKEMCMAAWERQLGLPLGTVGRRLAMGWTVHQALTTPEGQRRKRRYG
ncbi:hypothetical protein ELI30_09465 [Rhizobium leguminosarum]|uniref:hypothetical protein n=1 Tax=Rhizobium leguminosarum TaxID=384 RepID=UPI0010308E97|nr:hypothetical protein [Rhizobium leguminosarum]TAV48512.1 hypothetical protein ELI32_09920 [Rhizobium leguminosarum]TAV58012.1 hypothetical protein ELI31_09450 [Rhizobium leguminosarum]TAV68953.1 hypothetical protein ELI30_09465 [Rhizobium leguminosarum]